MSSPQDARRLEVLRLIVIRVWPAIRKMLWITNRELVTELDELVRDLER